MRYMSCFGIYVSLHVISPLFLGCSLPVTAMDDWNSTRVLRGYRPLYVLAEGVEAVKSPEPSQMECQPSKLEPAVEDRFGLVIWTFNLLATVVLS